MMLGKQENKQENLEIKNFFIFTLSIVSAISPNQLDPFLLLLLEARNCQDNDRKIGTYGFLGFPSNVLYGLPPTGIRQYNN